MNCCKGGVPIFQVPSSDKLWLTAHLTSHALQSTCSILPPPLFFKKACPDVATFYFLDSKWIIVECQPCKLRVDGPLLQLCNSFLSSAKRPLVAKQSQVEGLERHTTLGVKLFLTGVELLLANDLALAEAMPICVGTQQLFVTTHPTDNDGGHTKGIIGTHLFKKQYCVERRNRVTLSNPSSLQHNRAKPGAS